MERLFFARERGSQRVRPLPFLGAAGTNIKCYSCQCTNIWLTHSTDNEIVFATHWQWKKSLAKLGKCGAVDTRSSERFHTTLALILLLRLNENFLFLKYNLNLLNFVIPHVARREPRIAGLRKGEARANPALSKTSGCANKIVIVHLGQYWRFYFPCFFGTRGGRSPTPSAKRTGRKTNNIARGAHIAYCAEGKTRVFQWSAMKSGQKTKIGGKNA